MFRHFTHSGVNCCDSSIPRTEVVQIEISNAALDSWFLGQWPVLTHGVPTRNSRGFSPDISVFQLDSSDLSAAVKSDEW